MIVGDGRPVRSEVRGDVGVISLARPERLNALTAEGMRQLGAELLPMSKCRAVRAIVLRGEGRAFCVGADLESGVGDPTVTDPVESAATGTHAATEAIWAMRTVPQPVIAAINGHAIGAGFALAAAADVRIVGVDATFSAPFVKLGLTVGDLGLSWFLPRIIGHGRASELFFSGGTLEAQEDIAYGLASRISEDPFEGALAYADEVAAFPPDGVQTSKSLINAGATSSLRDHLDAEPELRSSAASPSVPAMQWRPCSSTPDRARHRQPRADHRRRNTQLAPRTSTKV